jgi:hypothetical protein
MKYNHTVRYDRNADRWCCECGYTLGDGRKAFLAPCPAKLQQQPTKAKAKRKKR